MTDKEIIEDQDQDVELQEDDEEILEMQHDPKNAEAQSIAATDKAGDATGTAKLPSMGTAKNVMKRDPMPKLTKAGMINAMYKNMKKADKKKLEGMYNSCLLYTSPSPRDQRGSRMPSSA